MSRSYNQNPLNSDNNNRGKQENQPVPKTKRRTIIKQESRKEGERYIDQRSIEVNISFQVAGIIAKSLQVTYDDWLKTDFMIEKIIEDESMIPEKLLPKHQSLLREYCNKKLSYDEIMKEIQIAITWIMKERTEEEKKLRSIEICYNQQHT